MALQVSGHESKIKCFICAILLIFHVTKTLACIWCLDEKRPFGDGFLCRCLRTVFTLLYNPVVMACIFALKDSI